MKLPVGLIGAKAKIKILARGFIINVNSERESTPYLSIYSVYYNFKHFPNRYE